MDDYDKILNDYINQESDDKIVISFSEHGNEIRIRYKYTNNMEDDYKYEMTISLLDLVVFVYSLTPKI